MSNYHHIYNTHYLVRQILLVYPCDVYKYVSGLKNGFRRICITTYLLQNTTSTPLKVFSPASPYFTIRQILYIKKNARD